MADLGPFQSDTGRWLSMHSPAQLQRASAASERRSAFQASIETNHDLSVPAYLERRFAAMETLVGTLAQKLDDSSLVPALPGGSLGYQLQQMLAGWFGIGNNQLMASQDKRIDRLIV